MNITLRDYQDRDVKALRHKYAAKLKAPLYVLSTGGGKTVIFCFIADQAAKRGNRVLVLVHRQELLNQTSGSLDGFGVDHGLIAPNRHQTYDRVQVASVQTLVRRLGKMTWKPGLIIVDEAHHAAAGSWNKIIDHFAGVPLLGVTATPHRLDGKGLGTEAGGHFDCMVEGPSIRELIERGYLCRPRVYAPPTDLILDNVKNRMGDYARNDLEKAVDKPKITGSAVEHYMRICPGKPAIAFCVSVAHAEHVAEEFKAAGFKAASIDGSMDDNTRKGLINALARGGVDVLTSCEIISEGTDIPVVTAAILLRPTKSLTLYLQQVGRALRPVYPVGADLSDDAGRLDAIARSVKTEAVILDHVGNCLRHGLPDEVRQWRLDGDPEQGQRGGKKKDEPGARIMTCPQCFGVHPPMPRCPQCGHAYKPDEVLPDVADGELQEVDPAELAAIKADRRKRQGQAKTLQELEEYGKQMGYKPGWAKHVYNSRRKRSGAPALSRV